jgi:hypothetical protein
MHDEKYSQNLMLIISSWMQILFYINPRCLNFVKIFEESANYIYIMI